MKPDDYSPCDYIPCYSTTNMKINEYYDDYDGPICEHCDKQIATADHITIDRSSGPSTHTLHFHEECWRCPKCGTNGPHYCPADVATD